MSYEDNIFWSEIPKDAVVYDTGHGFAVHTQDGRMAVAYWTGDQATQAQAALRKRARPKADWERDKGKPIVPKPPPTPLTPKSEAKFQRARIAIRGKPDAELQSSQVIVCRFPQRRRG
jgi:hypothetical protein